MIIEVIGLPGSSKSTLCKEIVKEISNAHIIEAPKRFPRLFYFLSYSLKHPMFILFWKTKILQEGSVGLYRYIFHLWWTSVAKYEKALSQRGISIIDEGMVQRILTVFEHKVSEKTIKKALNNILIPDIMVISVDGTFDRFVKWDNKNNSPRCKKGQKYLEDWKDIITHNHDILLKVLKKKYPQRVIIFSKDNNLKMIAGNLRELMN